MESKRDGSECKKLRSRKIEKKKKENLDPKDTP